LFAAHAGKEELIESISPNEIFSNCFLKFSEPADDKEHTFVVIFTLMGFFLTVCLFVFFQANNIFLSDNKQSTMEFTH